jgi:beta-glucanase (GH16 family)
MVEKQKIFHGEYGKKILALPGGFYCRELYRLPKDFSDFKGGTHLLKTGKNILATTINMHTERRMIKIIAALLLSVALFCSACNSGDDDDDSGEVIVDEVVEDDDDDNNDNFTCDLLAFNFDGDQSSISSLWYPRDTTEPGGPGANLFPAENVTLTDDGRLRLDVKGYDEGGNYVHEGGQLATNGRDYHFAHYRVLIKPVVEVGVVTAFFTYQYDANLEDNNHEIDVEILKESDGVIRCYFTTWRSYDPDGLATDKESSFVELTPEFAAEFHTYGFDWYFNRVEFFIDGELKQTHTVTVPDELGFLMLNAWPAPDWAGLEFYGEASALYDNICVGSLN